MKKPVRENKQMQVLVFYNGFMKKTFFFNDPQIIKQAVTDKLQLMKK